MRKAFIVLVVVLTMGGAAAVMPAPNLFYELEDDAFYYLEIARHVASGDGFTFDGLHRTNGFHPLWLFTLIPIVRALHGDVLPVRAMIVLQVLFVALAALQLDAIVRHRLGRWAASTAVLVSVALPGTVRILACGMESALLLLLVVRVMAVWLDVSRPDVDVAPRRWLVLGLWCALAFLARLEAGLLVPVVALLAYPQWRRRPAILFALLALPMTIGLGYLSWNRLAFGLWIPISGIVKMSHAVDPRIGIPISYGERLFWSFRALFGAPSNPYLSRLAHIVFLLSIFGGIVVIAVAHRRIWSTLCESGLGAPFLMCMALWLGTSASRRVAPWYPVAMLLVVALLVAICVRSAPRLAMVLTVALAALGIGRGLVNGWRQLRFGDDKESAIADMARWARDNIPKGDRIGSWNAGMFAWLSHATVINLDGLVNDETFYSRVIVGYDLKGYAEDECIRWFSDEADPHNPRRPLYGWTTHDALVIPMRLVYMRVMRANTLAAAIWRNEDREVCRAPR